MMCDLYRVGYENHRCHHVAVPASYEGHGAVLALQFFLDRPREGIILPDGDTIVIERIVDFTVVDS